MCQKAGAFLLAAVLVGLGVLNCAYPSEILLKTLKYYTEFVPVISKLHLNVVVGVFLMFAAVSLTMSKNCASCLVQTAILAYMVLQAFPYVPSFTAGEQIESGIILTKSIGLLGVSLLLKQ